MARNSLSGDRVVFFDTFSSSTTASSRRCFGGADNDGDHDLVSSIQSMVEFFFLSFPLYSRALGQI
ncbi:hypothetical protein M6B38_404205 [Iris pallida]|uniref:Uncharacterized protein n=1 Tax=Iris pallida TaxID=29817 RepID=A0AAX6FRD0_IRIPA|nr:hypothetical protein M6B38_404205 [Iris pallida]